MTTQKELDFWGVNVVCDTHWHHIPYSQGRYEGCKKLRVATDTEDLEVLRKGIWRAILRGNSGTSWENNTVGTLSRVIEANCILCDCHGNKKLNELIIRAAKWLHQHPEAYGSKYEVRPEVKYADGTCDRCGDGAKPEFAHVKGGVCFKCGLTPAQAHALRQAREAKPQVHSVAKPDPNTYEFMGGIMQHAPAEEKAKIKEYLKR